MKWRCALVFAAAGVVGAFGGSTLGKMVDGQKLLALFAVLMMVVGALMLRKRSGEGNRNVRLGRENFPKLLGSACRRAPVRLFRHRRRLPDRAGPDPGDRHADPDAVGSSLVAVTAFGLTTAANYAFSGLVDWPLAALFIGGGVLGGLSAPARPQLLADRRGR